MFRSFIPRGIPAHALFLLCSSSAAAQEPCEVRDIFANRCASCHDADTVRRQDPQAKPKSGFGAVLDLAALPGLDLVRPGDASGSTLYERITDASDPMPPKGLIPESEREAIRRWIAAGAKPCEKTAGDSVAEQARRILEASCYRCHGQNGTAEGGFGYLLDRERLVASGKVIPGDARKSPLFRRVFLETMPPAGANPRPTSAEIDVLAKWIDEGAEPLRPEPPPRSFVSNFDLLRKVQDDLYYEVEPRDRVFTRYFTLVHLYNAGHAEEELEAYRRGLSKLLNSLSWSFRITRPTPIDREKVIFRIDLRDFAWDEATWNALASQYPYGLRFTSPEASNIYQYTACELPILRADWFVFAASRPPLYHDLLQIPENVADLQLRLGLDVARDIERDRVWRAGFLDSGVAPFNNRVIERHDSRFGAYWVSYDFRASQADEKNAFTSPLGPGDQALEFQPDGSEIIFHLPNGFQAYMIVDAQGQRLDVAPIDVVSDPKQRDRQVLNGISCMTCHATGLIPKEDRVRSHVETNPGAFRAARWHALEGQALRDRILALYPPKDEFESFFALDDARFAAAVDAAGSVLTKTEPIWYLARRFEEHLDLRRVAAEVGVAPERLEYYLSRLNDLQSKFGPLLNKGGTVERTFFEANFVLLIRELESEIQAVVLRIEWNGSKPRVEQRPVDRRRTREPEHGDTQTHELGATMIFVGPGTYRMGSETTESGRNADETPHQVTLTQGYWMWETELTQGEWKAVMGTTPWHAKVNAREADDIPAILVSWNDAVDFCKRLTARERDAGRLPDRWEYRLPTEAEWEFACRAGTVTAYSCGNSESDLREHAWFSGNASGVQKVKAKGANPWGFHDLHGNVWEWCLDHADRDMTDTYRDGITDPLCQRGSRRVIRGGGWFNDAGYCRSAARYATSPDDANDNLGFRPVLARVP